jgi:hypothetical protein
MRRNPYLGPRRLTRIARLFGKKYSGIFKTHTERVAFMKGVEAVLNDMLKAKGIEECRERARRSPAPQLASGTRPQTRI